MGVLSAVVRAAGVGEAGAADVRLVPARVAEGEGLLLAPGRGVATGVGEAGAAGVRLTPAPGLADGDEGLLLVPGRGVAAGLPPLPAAGESVLVVG